MSLQSAADSMRIADMHGLATLKQTALQFIASNAGAGGETAGYALLPIELMSECLQSSGECKGQSARARRWRQEAPQVVS